MKGVRCSWVDMVKIRQALSNEQRGDQKALERIRCVGQPTVSEWRAACDVLEAVEEKHRISDFSHFQPSHAVQIARHFRKQEKGWSENTKGKIAEWVGRCEAEGWTVQQLRLELQAEAAMLLAQEVVEAHEIAADDPGEEAFDWFKEMEAIRKWLTRRRERFPQELRAGFTDLVRRVLDVLDTDHASGRQGPCAPETGSGFADAG